MIPPATSHPTMLRSSMKGADRRALFQFDLWDEHADGEVLGEMPA